MKLSDYVVKFLEKNGVEYAFGITGGAIIHIFDSLEKSNINYICPQHEQAAAMAADAYHRITGKLGVAIATSGPGATNLLTGTCCSYFDSIPVLLITGQVPTSQLKNKSNSRQIGFQETDIVNTFKPTTKYAVMIKNPEDIRYELEKAVYLATHGRKGPVLVDIPDDIQRAEINPENIKSFVPEEKKLDLEKLEIQINDSLKLIKESNRPVVILGAGVRDHFNEVKTFIENLGFPVALTWAAMDLFPGDYYLSVRDFGVTASRVGNYVVQNADLIIALGTRLDTHEAGSNSSHFGREAKKIVVDLDNSELEKYQNMGMRTDVLINNDVIDFFNIINKKTIEKNNIQEWSNKIKTWKEKYPICPKEYYNDLPINPYVFMDVLSKKSKEGDVIITDAGCNVTWTMQSYIVRKNQTLFSAYNHSPMGYSLPAAIGAAFAANKQIICIIGDGGIQMNIQELATIDKHKLPIKIFVMNNLGYGMIQQTQEMWLDSCYAASDFDHGLALPDLKKIANAYNIPTESINTHEELEDKMKKILETPGPMLIDVMINPKARIFPKLAFGKPIEDSEPVLSREEFNDNMVIKPLE
ncbi:thiamine pyrophosphate-binding protein [Candidatus Pacearchaeota archaeon]|nr:thiamine pyrophosphate-binding protein [Candidatus Pacearchaeota archaeon]